ncbi:MAG: 50S ribosomal protein L21 [Actinobacteria bacterium RBG_16_67_10]|nr:MAG: 50S ribosomal protein L21 [Actinobacteria bacterium RBG_16_67_10]
MTYAIIKVAGKQYRVREGERLLVDRLAQDDGATISPTVLLVGGDGAPVLDPGDVKVTAKVLGAVKGPKIRIGKYKKRTGYRKHTGFRASLTQIQIESIGGKPARASAKPKVEAEAKPKAEKAQRATQAAPVTTDASSALPAGYSDLTVAAIKSAAADWDSAALDAALAYEQEHGKRKGAIAALESARTARGGES